MISSKWIAGEDTQTIIYKSNKINENETGVSPKNNNLTHTKETKQKEYR